MDSRGENIDDDQMSFGEIAFLRKIDVVGEYACSGAMENPFMSAS
jgi:hypothetical protein